MKTFYQWVEDRMYLGSNVPSEIRHEIIAMTKAYPQLKGTEILNLLKRKGHEADYKQVMSVLTPIFRQRKIDQRMNGLGITRGIPSPVGTTNPMAQQTDNPLSFGGLRKNTEPDDSMLAIDPQYSNHSWWRSGPFHQNKRRIIRNPELED